LSDNVRDIESLIVQGESSSVEFKLSVPLGNAIAANLSAFANSSGGVLIVGVDDKGDVVGLTTTEANQAMSELRRVASSLLPYPVEVSRTAVNGKTVVYAVIDPAPSHLRPVITAGGRIYMRQGSASRQLNEREEQAVLRGTDIAPRPTDRRCRAFVAMSFRTEEEPALIDYREAMKRAYDRLSLPIDLVLINKVVGDYEISQEIMNQIDECDIVIADFTLSPRNVYFELGYARGKDKLIIQTARQGTVLEFDVRNWRTEFYRNATELEERMGPVLEAAYARFTGQG
jgi:hypothetical protein